jgi:hypothetical protein
LVLRWYWLHRMSLVAFLSFLFHGIVEGTLVLVLL